VNDAPDTAPNTDPRLLAQPHDPDLALREQRLGELGLTLAPVRELDQFAERLAAAADAPYAMVNLVTTARQYFAGLHIAAAARDEVAQAAQAAVHDTPQRTMPRDHGYCPHVVVRRRALVLDDVCAYPRFSGNPVITLLGVRSYIGAPIIDDRTGIALGTICAVSTRESEWGRDGLALIKSMAAEVTDLLRRAQRRT
jgi:GAF domain-containing protein